jgi:hypothetical protein
MGCPVSDSVRFGDVEATTPWLGIDVDDGARYSYLCPGAKGVGDCFFRCYVDGSDVELPLVAIEKCSPQSTTLYRNKRTVYQRYQVQSALPSSPSV